jgi:hypothetical protein
VLGCKEIIFTLTILRSQSALDRLFSPAVSISTFGASKGARNRAEPAAKVTACMCITHLGVGDDVGSGVGDGVGSGVGEGVALQTHLAHEVPRKRRSTHKRVSNGNGFSPPNQGDKQRPHVGWTTRVCHGNPLTRYTLHPPPPPRPTRSTVHHAMLSWIQTS